MNNDNHCLFCDIAQRKIPSDIIYEDEFVVVFRDIAPKAPVHLLVVPRKHIETIDHLDKIDQELVGHMILIAQKIARDQNISDDGYRLVFNVKKHAGQMVDHIHLHILGGKPLGTMV